MDFFRLKINLKSILSPQIKLYKMQSRIPHSIYVQNHKYPGRNRFQDSFSRAGQGLGKTIQIYVVFPNP